MRLYSFPCQSYLKKMEVTLDTIIGDIVDFDEDTAEIFLESGMHCIDCPVSRMETVEEACMVHGVDPDELIEKLNKYFADKEKKAE